MGFYFDGAPFASPGHGFSRSKEGALTTIDFPGATSTLTVGINSKGDVVGGQFTFVDCPGTTSTDADGLNSEGDLVGGCVDAEGHHAYAITK